MKAKYVARQLDESDAAVKLSHQLQWGDPGEFAIAFNGVINTMNDGVGSGWRLCFDGRRCLLPLFAASLRRHSWPGIFMTLRSAALVAALALLAACSNGTAPAASTRTAPAAASSVPAVAAAPAPSPPYALEGTEVRELPSKILGRDYQLDVYLPDSYAQEPKRSYPVVFVTDAPYAFPLIRSIARRVGDHGDGLRDFILVGLSYAKGDTPKYSRNRDYTPTAKGPSSAESDMPPWASSLVRLRMPMLMEVRLTSSIRLDCKRQS